MTRGETPNDAQEALECGQALQRYLQRQLDLELEKTEPPYEQHTLLPMMRRLNKLVEDLYYWRTAHKRDGR